MRDVLITGLLISMPTAVLLASAALAVLVSNLRRRLQRAVNRRFKGPAMTSGETGLPRAVWHDREQLRSDALPLDSLSAGRLHVVEQALPAAGCSDGVSAVASAGAGEAGGVGGQTSSTGAREIVGRLKGQVW